MDPTAGNDAARIAELEAALAEARDQQTALAEVLEVIATSATDAQPVLQTITERALRLCQAGQADLLLVEGDSTRVAARAGAGGLLPDARPLGDVQPIIEGRASTPVLREGTSFRRFGTATELLAAFPVSRFAGGEQRVAVMLVPLVRDGAAMGLLFLTREGPRVAAFSDGELALVETFADQAVIAIENARLFNELEARNRDVTEALEQQTAMADVLEAIAASPADLDAVLPKLAAAATQLCEADNGVISHINGDVVTGWSSRMGHQTLSGYAPERARSVPGAKAIRENRAVLVSGPVESWEEEFPYAANQVREAGGSAQSFLAVPLPGASGPSGTIVVIRDRDEAFNSRHVAILEVFANQAAIAIANARLFNELEESNREVSEALEQQSAMAEVLGIIAGSATDARPVLDAIAARAAHLCGADEVTIGLADGEESVTAAMFGGAANSAHFVGQRRAIKGRISAEVFETGRPLHFSGSREEFAARYPGSAQGVELIPQVSVLLLPLLIEGKTIGVLGLTKAGGEPFSPPLVALMETFADQAVIAIENARLFNQLQERNREVTEALQREVATSGVLGIVSRSVTDPAEVFRALLSEARVLCRADSGAVHLRDGEFIVRGASLWTGESMPDPPPRAFEPHAHMPDAAIAQRRTLTFVGSVGEFAAAYPESGEFHRSRGRSHIANVQVPLGGPGPCPGVYQHDARPRRTLFRN